MSTSPYIYSSLAFWMEDGPRFKINHTGTLESNPHELAFRIYLRGCSVYVHADKFEEVRQLRNDLAAIALELDDHIAKHETAEERRIRRERQGSSEEVAS